MIFLESCSRSCKLSHWAHFMLSLSLALRNYCTLSYWRTLQRTYATTKTMAIWQQPVAAVEFAPESNFYSDSQFHSWWEHLCLLSSFLSLMLVCPDGVLDGMTRMNFYKSKLLNSIQLSNSDTCLFKCNPLIIYRNRCTWMRVGITMQSTPLIWLSKCWDRRRNNNSNGNKTPPRERYKESERAGEE